MRLKLFDLIDDTLQTLKNNLPIYHSVDKKLQQIFHDLMQNSGDFVIDIRSRIKSAESLREKIVRNRMYQEVTTGKEVLSSLSDLIGITIECRFIEEEHKILQYIREQLPIMNEDGFSSCEHFPKFQLQCCTHQPQIQKNGFAIYRIDGYYLENNEKINFELQIKSLVHSFWGEIEHKLVYKNTSYFVYDKFMKDILSSINSQLTITDRQLSIVYKQMQELSSSSQGIHENGFEEQCSKAINDVFAKKMNESLGFTLNIKHTSKVLGHFIFLKDKRYHCEGQDRISLLIQTFKEISTSDINFEHEIKICDEFIVEDHFMQTLGTYLLSVMNDDYDWFVFFKMLFAIEPGNDLQDFTMFLEVIKSLLIHEEWLQLKFCKLNHKEQMLLQEACTNLLASSLVEFGNIKILHNNIMGVIQTQFIDYIDKLEQRVLSYKDFMLYYDGYYNEWMQQLQKEIANL